MDDLNKVVNKNQSTIQTILSIKTVCRALDSSEFLSFSNFEILDNPQLKILKRSKIQKQ
jgi:hypothetical protein